MIKLSLQNTWAHKRRLVGTLLAVLIGVSFLAGTLVLGDTLRSNFDKLFASAYAGVDVVVRPQQPEDANDDSGVSSLTLDASIADRVSELAGVRAVHAETTGFGRVLDAEGKPIGGNGPPTLAANWDDDEGLNPYNLIAGRLPDGPEEVVLDDETMEKGELEVGDTTTILLPQPLEVEIVGEVQFGDGSTSVGVTYTFFSDEGAAAHLATAPGTANAIIVAAADGLSEEELLRQVEPVIGAGNEAVTATTAAEEQISDINDDFLGTLTTFLVVFAGIALFVATFSIYNTFSIIVAQRTRESALMRAIGATRSQVMAATMVEALLIALVASVLGLVGGIGVASGLKAMFDALGLGLPAGGLTIKTSGVVISLVVGVVVTVVAAVVPARRGSRVRPIEALRASALEAEVPAAVRSLTGLALAAAGIGVMVWSSTAAPDGQIYYAGAGAFATLIAMLVLGPVIARPVAGLLGAPFARLGGVTGELSRENAVRNPRRTASTAAALLVGVAIVVLFSVFIASLKQMVTDSVDRSFGGDFVIASSDFMGTLPPELAGQVAEVDGVDLSVGVGGGQVVVDGESEFVAVADVEPLASILDLGISSGSGEGFGPDDIAVSADRAKDDGLAVGDTVPVEYADGSTVDATVAMVYRNADILQSSFVVPRETFAAHTALTADAIVFVTMDGGARAAQVESRLERLTEPIGKPEIQDRAAYTESVGEQLDALLGIVILMLALAIIIAAMGIANTIALSVHERTRELGLLRAVGTTRRQVRRLVRWEAVIVSTFGTVGGMGLGIGLGWVLTRAAIGDSTSKPFALPVSTLVLVIFFGVVIGVIAAWRPSYRAANMEVLEAVSES